MRQITSTIASRVFVTAMNLLVMGLAGHALGARGLGIIGLIVLGITLVMLPTNLIGGGALVYLVPKSRLWSLLVPSYAWALVSCALCYLVLRVVHLVPVGFEAHICALAFLQGVYGIHLAVLVGQQRIGQHNVITAVHAVVLLICFALLLGTSGEPDAMHYIHASYIAFALTAVLSGWSMRWDLQPAVDGGPVLPRLLRQGALVQGANGLQLLNYRLAYWLIERFREPAALGIYTVGNQLSESAWIAPRSLGMVLLSRVSNSAEAEHQRSMTLTTARAAMVLAFAVVVVLAVLPEEVFRFVFGPEIRGLRPIMLLLAPGIIAMAASQAFSHYFSGKGDNVHNLVGSGAGMVVTVLAGPWMVSTWGLWGAATTASAAYGTSLLYQLIVFMRTTHSAWSDLLPNRNDLQRVHDQVKTLLAGR